LLKLFLHQGPPFRADQDSRSQPISGLKGVACPLLYTDFSGRLHFTGLNLTCAERKNFQKRHGLLGLLIALGVIGIYDIIRFVEDRFINPEHIDWNYNEKKFQIDPSKDQRSKAC
jgi:hypothetical protein